MENKQIQAHNYNLSYLLFAFDYIKLSLRLLQGSCFTQTDVNYCFISFLDDDSCARKTGKNNTYKHNWVELFSNSYSYFNATVFSRTIFLNNGIKVKTHENAGIKGNLISRGIFILVPTSKKYAKSLCFR